MVGAAMSRRKRPAVNANASSTCVVCDAHFAANPIVPFRHHGSPDLPRFACLCECNDTGEGVARLCRCCAKEEKLARLSWLRGPR